MLSFTCIALSTAAIVLGSLDSRRSVAAINVPDRALRWLGRHSYELYLFHIIVLAAMRNAVPGEALTTAWQIPWLIIYLAISSSVAAIIAQKLSEPANRALRRRFSAFLA